MWQSQNAAATTSANVQFLPLTDNLSALSGAPEAGISVGAVTVQPGGTGVVLAGLGDPSDALDSYYGAGLLRSTDSGKTWSLIQQTMDLEDGLGRQDYSFIGEGFAGFAWSSTNVQLVVAAVSQAARVWLVNAGQDLLRATRRALLVQRRRRDVASGPDHRLEWSRCAGAARWLRAAGWECSDIGDLEPGAEGLCGGGALPRVLPVDGRSELDADAVLSDQLVSRRSWLHLAKLSDPIGLGRRRRVP